jgi:hypothetical protein
MRKLTKKEIKLLQPYLWSYNLDGLEPHNPNNKREIITQVLNEGSLEAVKWLFKTYDINEIKNVVRNPRRGVWFKKSLDYWKKILNIKIKKDIYEKALFSLEPKFSLYAHKNFKSKSKINHI